MASNCNSYLPVYTNTTLQITPINQTQNQRKIKIIQNVLIILLSILLIGLACIGLYFWLFDVSSLEDTPEISDFTRGKENFDEDYPEDVSPIIEPTTKQVSNKLNSKYCGQASVVKKVQNGEFAHLNEFPWIVALYFLNTSAVNANVTYSCGGSLISEDLILTAGHCLVEKKDLVLKKIRLGELDFMSELDCDEDGICTDPIQDIYSNDFTVKIHPDFDAKDLTNDIGLIHLKVKAKTEQQNIKTICLPFDDDEIPEKLVVSGFGAIEFNMANEKLKYGAIELVSKEKCEAEYLKFKFPKSFIDSQFCALGKTQTLYKGSNKTYDVDTCKGDSGSPVQGLNRSGKIFQYGIVSGGYGKRCGRNTAPGFYTKVSSYLNWILENSKGNFK